MGNAKQPTIKSAAARLATRKLNGERRLRFGSIIIARRIRTFPVTAVTVKIEQNVADVMLKAVGAEMLEHGYNPIKDMTFSVIRPWVDLFLQPKILLDD